MRNVRLLMEMIKAIKRLSTTMITQVKDDANYNSRVKGSLGDEADIPDVTIN